MFDILRHPHRFVFGLLVVSALMVAIGCNVKHHVLLIEQQRAATNLAATLASIIDKSTARTHLEKMQSAYKRYLEAELAVYNSFDSRGRLQVSTTVGANHFASLRELEEKIRGNEYRLRTSHVIPKAFVCAMRHASSKANSLRLQARKSAGFSINRDLYHRASEETRLFVKFTPAKVIYCESVQYCSHTSATTDLFEAIACCAATGDQKVLPDDVEIVEVASVRGRQAWLIAPVVDVEAFAQAITFGKIEALNRSSGDVLVDPDEYDHRYDERTRSLFGTSEEVILRNTLDVYEQHGGSLYHQWLIDEFLDAKSPIHGHTRDRLLSIDPAEVAPQQRQQVVAALNDLVKEVERSYQWRKEPKSHVFDLYLHWTGNDGVPVVEKFIEEVFEPALAKSNQRFYAPSIAPFMALAKLGTPDAIAILIKYLDSDAYYKNNFNWESTVGEQVAWIVGRVGSNAEKPILEALANEQLRPTISVFDALSRLGTNKSLPVLRQYFNATPKPTERSRRLLRVINEITKRGGRPVEARKRRKT